MPFQHLVISVPVQNITKILRFCRFFYFVQPVTVCICLHLNFQKKVGIPCLCLFTRHLFVKATKLKG